MNTLFRSPARIAGSSYVAIFVLAIFANFFVLELLLNEPLVAVTQKAFMVRLGIMAFLVTAVFDLIVAWALYDLYKNHPLSLPSTYFRVAHAIIMGVAVFALLNVFTAGTPEQIHSHVENFNNIWLIGLFFFGVHLLFLSKIIKFIKHIPKIIFVAGVMYMVDTSAHFLLANYDAYAGLFLTLVAIPSIFGEMAFAIWLLRQGGESEGGVSESKVTTPVENF